MEEIDGVYQSSKDAKTSEDNEGSSEAGNITERGDNEGCSKSDGGVSDGEHGAVPSVTEECDRNEAGATEEVSEPKLDYDMLVEIFSEYGEVC